MLKSLHIENFALITKLDIDFNSGFSVITGETGAGKSIILGAISAVLGEKVRNTITQSFKENKEKTIVEAVFDISRYELNSFFEINDIDFDSRECIIRREITAQGKSRAFINDTPVSLILLRELGNQLIDIHSQHQNLLLNKENFQLSVVDIVADDKGLFNQYISQFQAYQTTCKSLEEAQTLSQKNKEDEEFLRFQLEQLREANLSEEEQEELEQEVAVLSHAEEIRQHLFEAYSLLSSNNSDYDTIENVRQSSNLVGRACNFLSEASPLESRLDSCYEELKDIADDLERLCEEIEIDPQRLDTVQERLDLIYSLQHRHHVNTVHELLTIQKDIEHRLSLIDNSEEYISTLQKQQIEEYEKLISLAKHLTESRKKAATLLEKRMTECLIPMGMPNVQFHVDMSIREHPDQTGMDKIIFLFSANKNIALQPLSQIASGGEIARVMLSIKSIIASAVKLPTIIFDEIDTGVSGGIAEKMAKIMREMSANNCQVISITHLPQIAAMGEYHYRVFKEYDSTRTTTHITLLNKKERVSELADMLSGETTSRAALENAKELLGYKSK